MTQMQTGTPLPEISETSPKKSGLGKFACLLTIIAGAGLGAAVIENLGQAAFSASLAAWGIAFLLTIASFVGHRKKVWAVLALLLNFALAAWFVFALQGT